MVQRRRILIKRKALKGVATSALVTTGGVAGFVVGGAPGGIVGMGAGATIPLALELKSRLKKKKRK